MQKVFFHTADRSLTIKNKTSVKRYIEYLFKQEKKELDRIDYIYCSDEYLLEMNKNHLNHDYLTDILTFELSPTEITEAEVYISLDRVKDNAKELQLPLLDETLRVIFHGALHLCGYLDKTAKDEQIMRKKEDHYIKDYLKKNS